MNYELMITDIVSGEMESPFVDAPPSALLKTLCKKGAGAGAAPVGSTGTSTGISMGSGLGSHAGITSRTPSAINQSLRKILSAVDLYAKKSKGQLESKDILLGTCIRFDTRGEGRIDTSKFVEILKLLQVRGLSREDTTSLVTWFDTNGARTLDYHELIRQLYGKKGTHDVHVLTRSIPDIMGKSNSVASPKMPTTKLLFDRYSTLDNEGGLSTLETDKTLNTKIKNTRFIQTPSEKKHQEVTRKREMLTYRADVVNRLQNVEQQRAALLGKLRRPNTVG